MDYVKDFMPISAIVVICTLIAEAVKHWLKDEQYKIIPLVCAVSGAIITPIAYYFGLVPVDNILSAIVIGIVSGWSATGVHQTYKQLKG